MESILSMQEEVYPLKSRRNTPLVHLSTTPNIKINTLNDEKNIFLLFFQYIKTMVAQRSVYILGILNLILAAVAIICVTQAEDHPEYFSLVYISVSIFIFYMATIIAIIALQIIETYREQNQVNPPSLSAQIPVSFPEITTVLNPTIVESMTTKTQAKTSLSRSQTLPLTSSFLNPHRTLSTSASSTMKDLNPMIPIASTRLALLPKYYQSIINTPKSYQSFGLTTTDQLCSSSTIKSNSEENSHLSTLIKPIPLKSHVNNSDNKSKTKS